MLHEGEKLQSKNAQPSLLDRAKKFRISQQYVNAENFDSEYASRILELEAQVKNLLQREAKSTEKARLASAQANQYKRQLADLKNKYVKQTERVTKFKFAYETLKNSPDVKIGRLVVGPVRKFRRITGRSLVAIKEQQNRNLVVETQLTSSPTNEVRMTSNRHSVESAKFSYRRMGKISEPISVMDALSDQLSSHEQVLLEQMKGLQRVRQEFFSVPPRQLTPGYSPKRGSVMYCAHSTGYYDSNGYSTRTESLVGALSKLTDLIVVARPGYPWDSKKDLALPKQSRFRRDIGGVTHVFNNGPSLVKDPLDLYVQYSADIFVREATAMRAERIHAASNHLTALPALIAARRLGIPFIYEVRGLWEITEASTNEHWDGSERFELAADLESLVAREADAVLAITRQVKDVLVNRGVEPERISLLPNAADPVEFAPVPKDGALLKRFGFKSQDVVVGYAGSIVEYEGLDVLVRGFALAHEEIPDAKLLVVGDGRDLSRVKEIVQSLGIQDFVTFTGRIKSNLVAAHVNLMDMVVCARESNTVTEMVSPIKPLEAFAAGKAVIASDVAPLIDLVGEDQTRGLYFKAGDAEQLSACIKNLSTDTEARAEIGRKARSWVKRGHDWNSIAQIVADVHETVLAERLAGQRSPQETLEERDLIEFRLALISDEFTLQSLLNECRIIRPHPDFWRTQLQNNPVDALLIESAWEGNDGAWHRKVGYYDDESFADLIELTDWCRSAEIPVLFWNKEDPVHFQRFKKTATLADHVFTTDANMIPHYFENRSGHNKTFASLPFWAQPSIHNPLAPQGSRINTVAYGGSFYGDRYPERSRTLETLLGAVSDHGLTIYDRQANHPNSPYHYPSELLEYVQGGLTYAEMLQAYKWHPIHINVNSVVNSPTMFSRRVVELAASGTPIISGPGKGVEYTFNGLVPTTTNRESIGDICNLWIHSESDRLEDGWNLHRHVFRAHLARHRLSYMLRTAGLRIRSLDLTEYSLQVSKLDRETLQQVLDQTVRPAEICVTTEGDIDPDIQRSLERNGITLTNAKSIAKSELVRIVLGDSLADQTAAEDLLEASKSSFEVIQLVESEDDRTRRSLWEPVVYDPHRPTLLPPSSGEWEQDSSQVSEPVLALVRPRTDGSLRSQQSFEVSVSFEPRRVVVAGHDLKFASTIIDGLKETGHDVRIDEWTGHSTHDEAFSQELLTWANSIFCEWSLGNLEWYSTRRKSAQSLVTRFHSQELFLPHMSRIDSNSVDRFIFVGDFVRRRAIHQFSIDENRTVVVPNSLGIDPSSYAPNADRRFTLGLVGVVPQQKHLDRALDMLSALREVDERYTLRVKGKLPEDYPWMLNRPEEMKFYEKQYSRISSDPKLRGAVSFDGHGNDMDDWYRKIGIALSVSDFESFHLTLADGGGAAALPVSLTWPGAEFIYPDGWLFDTVPEQVEHILSCGNDSSKYLELATSAQDFASDRFKAESTIDEVLKIISEPHS